MQPCATPRVSLQQSVSSPSLDVWETVTRHAIEAERKGRSATALAGYRRALALARQLMDTPVPGRTEDCVAALIVSWLNLADLQAARGDLARSAESLCHAHEAALSLYLDERRETALRHAALRHSRETRTALILHARRHGAHPLVTRTLGVSDLALMGAVSAAH